MTITEAVDSVNAFILAGWTLKGTPAELYWFETPKHALPGDNGSVDNQQVNPLMVVDTEIVTTNQKSLGTKNNRRFRRVGITTLRIMTPRKQGRQKEDELVNIAFDLLEGECTPEGVDFIAMTPGLGFDVGAWRVKQINVEFDYDEIK